jgi:hypothetical protein
MAATLVENPFDRYASGLLGCPCGHQRETTRGLDTARWEAAQRLHGGSA